MPPDLEIDDSSAAELLGKCAAFNRFCGTETMKSRDCLGCFRGPRNPLPLGRGPNLQSLACLGLIGKDLDLLSTLGTDWPQCGPARLRRTGHARSSRNRIMDPIIGIVTKY
jgi:hypothetical protein